MAHSDPFQHETGLDLDDLILFWHIVQQGHFGRAARVMGFSQPKVSRKVWKLEKYFGTTLMLRGTKGVILTSTGKEVLEMARGVVEKVHAMRARSNDHKNEMRGEISIICTPGFAHFWLFQAIKVFSDKHKDVRFRIMVNDFGSGDLMLGEADIVISSFPPEEFCGTESRMLCTYPLYFYASQDYLEKNGIPRSLEELSKHGIVIVHDQSAPYTHPMVNGILVGANDETPPKILVSNEAALTAAMVAGLGISIVSSFFAERSPSLTKIELSDQHNVCGEISHKKYISWNQATCETGRHEAFLSFIKEYATSSKGFEQVWEPSQKP